MAMRRNPLTGQMEDDGGYDADRDPNLIRPTDTGGTHGQRREIAAPAAAPSQQQRKGYQAPKRTAPGAWGGGTATVPPPPPPIAAPRAAPNFGGALAGLGTATRGAGYTSAQSLNPATRGAGYRSTTQVASAPDFQGIAREIGGPKQGPRYGTASGSWQGEALLPDLNAFSKSWMQEYNPLNSQYGQTARAAMDANLRKSEQDQVGGIEEWAASRGLVGSSYEGDQRVALSEAQQRARLDEEMRMMDLMAQYEMQGRGAALQGGLATGQFGQSLGNDRRNEGQFQWTADRTTARDLEDDSRFRTGLNLDAAGMSEDANRFRADFAEDASRYGYETDYRAGRDFEGDTLNRYDRAEDAARFGWETNRIAGRDYEGDMMQRAGLSLEALGMESDADLDRYLADMEAKRFSEGAVMDRARLAGENDDRSLRAWDSDANRRVDYDRMAQDDARLGADDEYRWSESDREGSQYDRTQTEAERANRERERIAETAALAELLESGIGDEGITPEMAKIIKERTGFDIPVTPKKAAAGDPTNPVVGGLYDERPKTLPPGKTKKDGYYTRDRVTGKYTWKDDRQDSWNPADWWQGEK